MSKQERLPFELDEKIDASLVTAHAGAPGRTGSCGAAREMDSAVVTKRRKRGLEPSELAEGLFALWLVLQQGEHSQVSAKSAPLAGLSRVNRVPVASMRQCMPLRT